MNRRRFLAFLGIAPAVVAAAPVLSAATNTTAAKLGEWNNYHSVSSPEIKEALDEYDTNEMIGKWISYKFQYTATSPHEYPSFRKWLR